MAKRTATLIGIVVVVLVVMGMVLWNTSTHRGVALTNQQQVESNTNARANISATNSASDQKEDIKKPTGFEIRIVAQGLHVPWSIVFTSKKRILVTERSGEVRVIQDGKLQEQPLYTFADVSQQSEEGLMGLVLDPEYENNKLVYACVAHPTDSGIVDSVVQLHDDSNTLSGEKVILDGIPAAQNHAGCRLKFGPDSKLYITTGDASTRNIAQDLDSLGGKILRINTDGSIPSDNPFPNSPVYSYGHRNPQGISWIPETSVLISTEHGPSGFDGPGGGDEINRIEPGKNYGWPIISHDESRDGLMSPLKQYTPAVAPASALVYSGAVFSEWKNNLFFGALRGQGIYRVQFTDAEATAIAASDQLDIHVGRVRDVVEGPDGLIYFSTSNTDGRGTVREGDDKIYVIMPKY